MDLRIGLIASLALVVGCDRSHPAGSHPSTQSAADAATPIVKLSYVFHSADPESISVDASVAQPLGFRLRHVAGVAHVTTVCHGLTADFYIQGQRGTDGDQVTADIQTALPAAGQWVPAAPRPTRIEVLSPGAVIPPPDLRLADNITVDLIAEAVNEAGLSLSAVRAALDAELAKSSAFPTTAPASEKARQIGAVTVTAPSGRRVRFGEIAKISTSKSPREIRHEY
jgi:multidrug efflux pump subunit AcrB